MNITIDLKPEVQAELSRQAEARGIDITRYAASVLEEAINVPVGSAPLSQQQLDETLEEFAQYSYKIPLLPDEAFARESLYRDHD